ncbi:MAG TPA: GNAT family N-acetyltransferase [Chloroflexota bacterium]|nr:GNAT family N-acetyltransferase [Chloroflexota bacterium]
MNPLIRRFTTDDYPAVVAVHNAVYPDYPDTEAETRFYDEHRDQKCHFERWVAERDDAVVAVGQFGQAAGWYHPQKFWMELAVHPDHQGRGVGSALYDHILAALRPLDPLVIRAGTREDKDHSVQFLANRGFHEDMRSWESRLDVAAFDPSPYAGVGESARAQGIEIKTLRELAADPNRDAKLYEQDWELEQDVPHPEPLTRIDVAFWEEHTLRNPNLLPDGYFVAVDGDAYVGVSTLWTSQGNDDLYTGLTGVKRTHRRRGIALALKLRAIAFARTLGRPAIRTWNDSNNRAMLSINERLGFVKQPAWIDYAKVFATDDDR